MTATQPKVTRPDFPSQSVDQPTPSNIPAEQAVLGSLLINNNLLDQLPSRLRAEHFFISLHARIFDVICARINGGKPATPTLVAPSFQADEAIQDVGGPGFLANLTESAVSPSFIADYGQAVLDAALRRDLIALGDAIKKDAFDGSTENSPEEQIRAADQKLYELWAHGQIDSGVQNFQQLVKESVARAHKTHTWRGETIGVATNFVDIDHKTGGLHESDLVIVAGRTSMGKSALAVNIAQNVARNCLQARAMVDEEEREAHPHRHGVAYFSLEMSALQLATRIIGSQAQVPPWKVSRGTMDNEEFQRFAQTAAELVELPLFIDDTASLTIDQLCTRARRIKRENQGLDLIIVDYLQLVESSQRRAGRVEQVAEISRGLKGLAKELNLPVVALAQLSRQVEGRENKKPQLADLRESGSIEQDADIVAFVHREAYYLERNRPPEHDHDRFIEWQHEMEKVHNLAELHIAKHRNGPTGVVELFYDGNYMQFQNFSKAEGYGDTQSSYAGNGSAPADFQPDGED